MVGREYDRQNAEITRQSERAHARAGAEERRILADLRRYELETRSFVAAAAELDPAAIRHLRNRCYSWERMAMETGRSVDELQRNRPEPPAVGEWTR